MTATYSTNPDGTRYRDLNGNGTMDPYENPDLPVADRVRDLLSRMTLAEKAGLMIHSIVSVTVDGHLDGEPIAGGRLSVEEFVQNRSVTHLNVHRIPDPLAMARWSNQVQRLAENTRLGIPVTISTDPRHSFTENWGASFSSEHLSAWPEPIGLGALADEDAVREFADIARQEYVALGIRSALHPTLDVATEPRWARQYSTFGQSADLAARLGIAYVDGFEGAGGLSSTSVACMAKHFPGGGPQRDGEDPHFQYGKEQDYPGGMFEYHLEPFTRVLARGVSAVMPSYGVPVGLELDGERIEEVGFGFNRQILTGLLREKLGFQGVVCSDWGLITESRIQGKQLPPRCWGVEDLSELDRVTRALDAGVDQLGGEDDPSWIIELVESGRIPVERIDASVSRLLTVKFQLGLFDDPYVDEQAAPDVVGSTEFRAAGHRAQVASATILPHERTALPLEKGTRVFSPEVPAAVIEAAGLVAAEAPGAADVVVTRIAAPYEPRDGFALEAAFHAGTLEFDQDTVDRLQELAEAAPVVLVVHLERPAILTPLVPHASTVVAVYGSSDEAVLEALTRPGAARGTLPFDVPRSTDSIVASRVDVPGDATDPLFRAGV
ncbi:glycoside hydrolase family 3 protein [Kineococcus esterisolvens]|uniref:glycoside hydrolase family 3 protein n=1 Tax=unclassified Kineococcus TaxID=2621656 RepID=UPI003D7DFA46